MRSRALLLRVASLALLAIVVGCPALAADDGDAPSTTTNRCPLGKAKRGTITVTLTPDHCGMAPATNRTVSIASPSGAQLLSMQFMDVERHDSDFCPGAMDPVIDVRCRRNRVEIFLEEDGSKNAVLSLALDPDTDELKMLGPTPVANGWRRPPLSGPERNHREALAHLIKVALDNHVAGVDAGVAAELQALIARDRAAAGEWLSADALLAEIESGPQAHEPPVASRLAQVHKLLSSARARTVPVTVKRLRLGTTLTVQNTPLDVGTPASMFWVANELCVIQEEKPPRNMRCYSTATRSWGPTRPIVRPASDGTALKVVEHPGHAHRFCDRRAPPVIAPTSVADDQIELCGDYEGGYLDELVAVVEGKALLLAEGGGGGVPTPGDRSKPEHWRLDAGPTSPAGGVDPYELVLKSAGSTLIGGCCTFRHEGDLRWLAWDGEKTWDIRGKPPKGSEWVPGPPLASPDQRWAVAQSQHPGGKVALWLLEVERKPETAAKR